MQVGKYELIRELAIGGMAEVFLARTAGPMGFEKLLVLKRILPHMAKEPAFVEMFLSEATLAARLTHPNIVQIFDFGEADGAYFLAMEYLDGPSLRTLLEDAYQRQVVLPPVVCARIIANACEGLAFAHDFTDPATRQPLDIVHRDISPDNILLSRQGAVKVADFGIAKASGQRHRTQTGIIKGKLAYMPPEQVRAQTLDRRVDVYALGTVFYELVTGQRPFEAPTDASLMQSILFEQPMPAVLRQPDLPEPVQRIIRRAIAKDREQRYPDCVAFQADLEEFILSTGKPVTTQHVAQLIAQISPAPRDVPLPPLPLGSPPLEDTAIRPQPRSAPPAAVPPRASAPEAPVAQPSAPAPEAPVASGVPAAQAAPVASAVPVAPVATPAGGSGRLLAAVAGAVLIIAGGGYLSWRPGASPPTVAPPAVPAPAEAAALPVAPEEPAGPVPAPSAPEAVTEVVPEAPLPTPALPPPSETPVPPTSQVSTTAAKEPMGYVEFRVNPHALVSLKGQRLGSTRLGRIQISAGKYNFKFTFSKPKKEVVVLVNVIPDETAIIRLSPFSDAGLP
jgi:serine/threonine protein kinase